MASSRADRPLAAAGIAFVDTNVFVYAVGRAHPLRDPARRLLRERQEQRVPMATSAEVLQELLHVYLPVGRTDTLDAALRLAIDLTTVWPVEASDVQSARELAASLPGLGARDLLHLAMCRFYGARELLSYDRALVAAFGKPPVLR
jgi:predicted nucleic acid-binding protein